MTFTIVMRPQAQVEFDEGCAWYSKKKPGLGAAFAQNVQATLNSLVANPKIHQRVYGEVRRAVVQKFPYAVYYYIEGVEVVVLSVFFTKRDPRDWQERV